jgi:hypothetical protein
MPVVDPNRKSCGTSVAMLVLSPVGPHLFLLYLWIARQTCLQPNRAWCWPVAIVCGR